MKLDREMEMLLDEIPLLHHGDLLGCGETATGVADGADADFDFSYLIQELGEMGFVDDEDEDEDENGEFSSFLYPRKASSSPTSNLHFMDAENFVASRPFSTDRRREMSLFDPFPFSSTCFDAAATEDWDFQAVPAVRSRPCKTSRPRKATSPKKCAAAKPSKYESLVGLRGYMYHVAKDQHGCRFLQQRLDDGKREVDFIFNGVARHAVDLMVNPFGNYLMQKLLAVCHEEQRMGIVLTLTKEPLVLVRISLNVHGTRAVQKLIESLRTKEEIQLVVAALRPGFLELIKDPNGNHVVQKCLQSFGADDNKPIFDAAAIYCLDIGMQCHGCCVLQRCIARSTSEHKERLVAAIARNGFELAQDAYGNYVVQYVIELKVAAANASLAQQFEGKYVQLSMQKFSSNVVEKCLKVFKDADKANIILELLAAPHFERLLQHPYANYVVYAALQNSKGALHSALTNAMRPHVELLRTSPYCKRIYSRALLKK
ncbi:putative pumilio homolog 7, chloroplastic [Lolium rigidum]|uniref:putative pumilio homolog 7, chloroplastic n=1 Tax=Lolium rigidum TaxID=89674 RepID=UPI001F5DE135|nr:putative pumilio homolog 7, chloroplastic [Lolium rigidum]